MNRQKETILTNLKNFPYAYKVFMQAIEQRLASNNFLENPLIIEVYKNDPGIPDLEQLVKDICSSKVFDITELNKTLNGKDKNFDLKMDDFYALLHGIRYFIKKGATEIHLIDVNKSKGISKKTPDLKMIIDSKETYAEVKNINEQDKLFNVIQNLLEAKSILNPNPYVRNFVINAKTSSVDFDMRDYNRIKKITTEFTQKVDVELSRAEDTFSFKIDEIYFTIGVEPSEKHHIIFNKECLGSKRGELNTSGEFFFYGKMYYKTLKKIYEAFLQLLSNRRGDFDLVKNDFIYLYFIGKGGRDVCYGDSFRKKFNSLIDTLDINKIVNIATNLVLDT